MPRRTYASACRGLTSIALVKSAIARVAIALDPIDDAATNVRLGVLRGELDCLSKICDRPIARALGFEDATTVEVRIGVPRIDLNRLGIVCNGVVVVTLEPVDDATANIRLGVPGIDLDRLRIVCDRVVTIALDVVDDATTGIRVSVVRVGLDRLRIICDCLVVLTLDPVDACTDIVGDRAIGSRLIWSLQDLCAGDDGGVRVTRPIAPIPHGLIGTRSGNCRDSQQQSRRRRDRYRVSHHRFLRAGCTNLRTPTYPKREGVPPKAAPNAKTHRAPSACSCISHLSEKRIGTVRSIRGWVMLAGNGGSG